MAHIRKLDTIQRRNGRTVSHYEVRWSEITISVDGGRRKRYKQETFPTRTLAEARLAEIESERAATGAVTGREARLEPFAAFAFAWLDSLAGTVKARTLAEYRRLYDTYVAPEFATRPIGAVSPADARRFRADLVNKGLARGTIKHAFDVFRRIMDVAVQDGAIPANPAASVPLPRTTATGDTPVPEPAARRDAEPRAGLERAGGARGAVQEPVFAPHPLTSDQVARISAHIGARHKVYGLVVLFLAYSGLRAGELAGPPLRSNAPSGRGWETGTPKSRKSRRVVPLDSWLADDLGAYLADHPNRGVPTAPLFPKRRTARWTGASRWSPGRCTRTCSSPPWLRWELPRRGCTIYAIRTPCLASRQERTTCRCRSGLGTRAT
jgi:integrase